MSWTNKLNVHRKWSMHFPRTKPIIPLFSRTDLRDAPVHETGYDYSSLQNWNKAVPSLHTTDAKWHVSIACGGLEIFTASYIVFGHSIYSGKIDRIQSPSTYRWCNWKLYLAIQSSEEAPRVPDTLPVLCNILILKYWKQDRRIDVFVSSDLYKERLINYQLSTVCPENLKTVSFASLLRAL